MLLRCVNQAFHSPKLLVESVLGDSFEIKELVLATETLGLIDDLQLSLPVIERQLQHADFLVIDAAINALRIISLRNKAIFTRGIRQKLMLLATASDSLAVRICAADALADFQFA